MKILIIGKGGREHAFAWKVAQSKQVSKVYVAPGNAGTALETNIENVAIEATDINALVDFAKRNQIDLTLVGPEDPLVLGIVDHFQAHGLAIFGPSQAAARLEGSKKFSKDFLSRHRIPTADYATFTDVDKACAYLCDKQFPIVIKADGLAAGKGVIIAKDYTHAENTLRSMLFGNAFGQAGHRVIIEQFLSGEEASFIVMVDGQHILSMASSQDHKRVSDGDTGLNTGGMGAYSPAPVVTTIIHNRIMDQIIIPTVQGMAAEGYPYVGFLYAGVMIDDTGQPFVIEFNCRCGDPETQPIMMRLESDLVSLCQAAIKGKLDTMTIKWHAEPAIGVVMAAGGYPENYAQNDIIYGLNTLSDPKCKVFIGGAKLDGTTLRTQGGRVLCVTAVGETLLAARNRAYKNVQKISWHNHFYRTDIAHRALARIK